MRVILSMWSLRSLSGLRVVADEPASPNGSPPDSPKHMALRSSTFFTNLDSSTTPTPN